MQNNKSQSIPKEEQEDLQKQIITKIYRLLDSRANSGSFFLYFQNTVNNINYVIRTIENITNDELQTFQDALDYSQQFFEEPKPSLVLYNNINSGKICFSMKPFNKVIQSLFTIQKRFFESSFKANYKELDITENSSTEFIEEQKEKFLNYARQVTHGSFFILSKSIDTIQTSMQNKLDLLHSNLNESSIAKNKIDEYIEKYNISEKWIYDSQNKVFQKARQDKYQGTK